MPDKHGLITDRSPSHVARLKRLRSIGWNNMTESQKTEYRSYATKGAYNYTDLNRVETAVVELSGRLGLTLTTKVDWGLWDVPTQSQMNRYLGNVRTIREKCAELANISDLPPLPESMTGLTYDGANSIEITLVRAYRITNPVPALGSTFILGETRLGGN